MQNQSVTKATNEWYANYYLSQGLDRNDLLSNPEVLFQYLAFEDSVINALRKAKHLISNRSTSKILDVGCGFGGSLARFLLLSFSPENLYGIDILEDRIISGQVKYPSLSLMTGDATKIPFDSEIFDLTLESTMFVQITDEKLSQSISKEMLRVTKPGGYLMLIDWRYGKPNNSDYLAVSRTRINKMFEVGSSCNVICQTNGPLLPPVGRKLSKYLPSSYFLLRATFPFLVGAKTTLLQKRAF